MSTLAYASLTAQREKAPPPLLAAAADDGTKPPNVSTYIDAMAALVPAEVLAFHAIMVSVSTKKAGAITQILDVDTLRYTFWTLIALSVLLYLVPHYLTRSAKLERGDFIRMLLPPLAFTAWTMLQRATAFDAIAPASLPDGARTLIALVLAALVGLAASILAKQAEKQPG
jgi:hypothetical protein